MAGIKPQQDELSQVTNYTASLQRYREYAATTLSTWPAMWAELSKQRKGPTPGSGCTEANRARWPSSGLRLPRVPKVRCNSAATGRPLALAYGAAGFSGSIGSRGVPVKQMLREACKQFPGRAVLVHEFRTSRLPAPTWWQAMQSPSGAQHGDAVPDPGLDVLNKQCHQAHVLRPGRVSRNEHPPDCSRARPPTRAQQLAGPPRHA
ncbi:hypothetical protein HaLaN_23955 [Haematococcus lacustris]|uniref:Uncharacterized protein n=1 Tax=Haematococcus lacustris TaxID=44745 RepID=A0A699ZU42_HAELA|nr:hypothetical protein HaLaN_23955 [Haematococcus lacustris]